MSKKQGPFSHWLLLFSKIGNQSLRNIHFLLQFHKLIIILNEGEMGLINLFVLNCSLWDALSHC